MVVNNTLQEKIDFAKLECSGLFDGYDYENMFHYIYPFTTENIAGYIDNFSFDNKTLLTVGSSLDQVINAALCGCKDIKVIDICPYVREYFYLKIAAMIAFEREEFLYFLCRSRYDKTINKHKAFKKSEYLKIRDVIEHFDHESLMFWDALYERYSGLRIRRRLFNYDELSLNKVMCVNPYLVSDEAYHMAREKLKNVTFSFNYGNLFNYTFQNTYDIINLSNVCNYHDRERVTLLFNKMRDCLSDNGIMLFCYLYLVDKTKACIDDVGYQDQLDLLLRILPKDIELHSFPTVSKSMSDKQDTIVTYKKIKKI